MFKFLWVGTITIVCSVTPSYVKAQFSDDFSDGNFTSNPAWLGSDSKFIVSAGQLKLQAPTAGNAYLSTHSESIENATWQFTVYLEFNPSSSNYTRVYLVSDKTDLSGSLNGYFVMVGDADDEISLYRQSGTTRSKIIDGSNKKIDASVVAVGVKVTRDTEGNWELFSDVGLTGTFGSEGTAKDITYMSSSFAGVYCVYTATRSDKFYFDNFNVTGEKAAAQNIAVPSPKDVIITELMADPSPRIELPEYEFVELYNRNANEYNLSNWVITDGSSTGRLTGMSIKPGEYLVLTSTAGVDAFPKTEPVHGVPGFPSLNNGGDVLVLKANGVIIDSISYSDGWYHDDEKKQGGWSLELIDPENLCSGNSNWTSSEAERGGTPGTQNSVFANKPDLTGPRLLRAIPVSSNEIKLIFDETLNKTLPSINSFNIDPTVNISSVAFYDKSLTSIRLMLQDNLEVNVQYTIQATGIYDCSGNAISGFDIGVFGLPEKALAGDVIINEVLFDPVSPGEDFVEVFNASSKFINLKNWMLSNMENDSLINKKPITTEDFLLSPHHYLVFTTDGASLKGQYPASAEQNFFEADLPPLPDDEGSIALLDDESFATDYFLYTDDMHSPFINNDEGISLERVSATGPSNDDQNWKSAASIAGATPGYGNSNSRQEMISQEAVVVSPEIFQPLYGQPDFAQIHYKFEQGGNVANVKIHDSQGRQIKQLANNDVLGTEGFYRWDGDQDDGAKARIGYYFVWFEIFNAQGEVKTFRKRVIVAGSF